MFPSTWYLMNEEMQTKRMYLEHITPAKLSKINGDTAQSCWKKCMESLFHISSVHVHM